MTDPTISIRNIHKTYNDEHGNPLVEALKSINLEIEENDFIAFLGPSGCGKTTLLRLIAGIEEPTSGSLSYRGKEIRKINTDVGYVPQGPGLFPWMTLQENIDLPLRIKKIDPGIRQVRIEEWLEKVGLTGFEDSYPWQLSGGMEKRGALVRALISHCEVSLMDEPFGPVDAQTKLVLQNDLLSLWSQIKSIVVFVTHDLLEAVTLSDKIVIFSKRPGQIKTVIPVDIPRPRNVYEIFRAERFNEIYDEVRAALRDEITLEG